MCASVYSTIKKGRTQLRIGRPQLLTDVSFISKILKKFILHPSSIEENLDRSVNILQHHNVLYIEDVSGCITDNKLHLILIWKWYPIRQNN